MNKTELPSVIYTKIDQTLYIHVASLPLHLTFLLSAKTDEDKRKSALRLINCCDTVDKKVEEERNRKFDRAFGEQESVDYLLFKTSELSGDYRFIADLTLKGLTH